MILLNLKEKDKKYIVNSYNRYDVEIEKGNNATCYDFSGKKYIDLTSGIGVNSLGFANEKINKAIEYQLSKFSHISNLYYTKPCVDLAEILCETSKMDKVFFCNSGTEANEGAIKAVRKYSFDKYGEGRHEIITLKDSFHGRTLAALTATGQDGFHKFFFPFLEGFVYADKTIQSINESITEKTCGIFIEVIQGEGGVVPLKEDFVKEVEKICKEKDILLVVDEVQTGIGRCGKVYSHEYFNIKPDIVTLAKGLGGGLPIGAILFNEKTSGVFGYSQHGSTFGGNLLASVSGVVVMEEILSHGFLEEVNKKGEYIRERVLKFKEVENVFNMGLMFGISLKEKKASEVLKTCIDKGLLILTAKDKVRLLPPLTITYEEIDTALNILEEVLN